MSPVRKVKLDQVTRNKELYFKIENADLMRPFFMSIVSDSNHWMFISSNGGLTAGRKNSEFALFPYYTDDKITDLAETTGSKTIIKLTEKAEVKLWEPFSIRTEESFDIRRNIYKNACGNKVLFEELNLDLELSFTYEWCSSNLYGFVRKVQIENLSSEKKDIQIVDGIQNILPAGVPSDLQNSASNLVNAYKRNELHSETGLGIYALSAIIVDKAEPSEALKANVVWSTGLPKSKYLLSSVQLDSFRKNRDLAQENDIKGERGAYFLNSQFDLTGREIKQWEIIAEVNQSHSRVFSLIETLSNGGSLVEKINKDIESGTEKLVALNASADGLQCTQDGLRDARHFSNVLFNNMRGGIFDNNYVIEKWDFKAYLETANKQVCNGHAELIKNLPEKFSLYTLRDILEETTDENFFRLSTEYLPLKFSRRHGDPSRPWNRFSINMVDEKDGSKILDYEGNWRDIFQNWEAMVHSFPDFIDGMIFRFLNASTFDGYNPYRITKGGFDWEVIEPDDPWSYIGYWGDHQVIYLLKFLEFIEKHKPGKIIEYFERNVFVYANVPYKIKSYDEILDNPKDTILFDLEADHDIRKSVEEIGADGALLQNENGQVHCVNFIEKILATVLSKLSNFIPEAGIWMNTQRPEWNDANNALVGNGVSMVTLYYLRRFFQFFDTILDDCGLESVSLSNELMDFYKHIRKVLEDNADALNRPMSDKKRRLIQDQFGKAASDYREHIYNKSFWGKKRTVSIDGLKRFIKLGLTFMDHSIKANLRDDGLYHAYNLVSIEDKETKISYLSEMLEGQVAVLSSGFLSASESLLLLDKLKASELFRDDQYSYLLYPNKNLPGFLKKNIIPAEKAKSSALITELLIASNTDIVEKDVFGQIHFNSNFRNANDLRNELSRLKNGRFGVLVEQESELLEAIFESIFNHKAFTGRSGTFYGYEGLGSIYWHMVSKLLLAVQECCVKAIKSGTEAEITGRLLEHFYEINEGIGVHKPPSLYGAFPIDPYSHTPSNKGAQQPGMTGQVKEDIITRFSELGVFVDKGEIYFYPCLLRKIEFLTADKVFNYLDVESNRQSIELGSDCLAFTYCQVPVVYKTGDRHEVQLLLEDGTKKIIEGNNLGVELSKNIFERDGHVKEIHFQVDQSVLK